MNSERERNSEREFGLPPPNSELDEMARADIGKRLVEIRGKHNQKAFADSLGLHSNTLGRYERGERWPDGDLLLRLRALGWNTDWILTGYGDPTVSDTVRGPFETGREVLSLAGPLRGYGINVDTPTFGRDFRLVPFYNVIAEGGGGSEVFTEEVVASRAFNRRWLEAEGLGEDKLSMITSGGNSMAPTIPGGYGVLVSHSRVDIQPGEIYVLQSFGKLVIKRLDQHPITGEISLISDNQDKDKYPTRTVPRELQGELHIAGKAVWWAPGKAQP